MPNPVVKAGAKKAGISINKSEEYWSKAKDSCDNDDYRCINGIYQKIIKNKKKSRKESMNANMKETKWSGKVKTKWEPKEGLFAKGTADEIANAASRGHGGDKGKAIKALNFYLNRGGSKISDSRKGTIRSAIKKLQAKKESIEEEYDPELHAQYVNNLYRDKSEHDDDERECDDNEDSVFGEAKKHLDYVNSLLQEFVDPKAKKGPPAQIGRCAHVKGSYYDPSKRSCLDRNTDKPIKSGDVATCPPGYKPKPNERVCDIANEQEAEKWHATTDVYTKESVSRHLSYIEKMLFESKKNLIRSNSI